ncbi:Outer membrane protein N [Serratia symbiotica]|nr:Outer membrane protein N [Serratia symbiotica]
MKRNILAVVIPALVAGGELNAAEIYSKDGHKLDLSGKVVGLHYFSKDKKEDKDKSFAHIGFKGETQINERLIGYGQWKYGLATNHSKSLGSRDSKTLIGFAGLKFAEYGSFDYGRNYGILYNVERWTDALPEFGGDTYSATDNFMTGRTRNVATYRNNNFFGLLNGLNFALQYQGRNTEKEYNIEEQNGEGWGISSTYNCGEGISIGAAYASSNRTEMQKLNNKELGKKAEAWTIGTKYDLHNIYLAAMYAETRNMTSFRKDSYEDSIAHKTHNFELTAQYQLDFGLRTEVSYLQSKGKNIRYADTRHDQDLVKYISVGSTYEFNKNTYTYIDYKINLLQNNKFSEITRTNTENVIGMGLVYKF